MDSSGDRNRIVDGIHNRGGPQFIQSSVNAFYYTNSSHSVPQRPRTVPRPVCRLFTGRQDVAAKLAQAFAPTTDSSSRSQRRFVIYGLGGTGKSEICLKFAEDQGDSYWGIFWIDCSNQSKAKEGFKRIADLCRLPTSDFEATKDYLSSSSEKWLLVLDNADDPEINYMEYMPSQKLGDIIITTRNEDLADLYATACNHYHLDQLQLDLARDLLLQAAGVAQANWQDKTEAASAIATELGRHTLAILQAAAFIKQSRCPIEEYLDLYYEHKDRLFKFSKSQELSAYKTVHATFEISILRLQSLGDAGDADAKNALNLLNILSFMHFEGSFQQIFASAATRAIEIRQRNTVPRSDSPLELSETHAKQLPQYFPKTQGSRRNLQWRQACNKLKMFSLIKMDAEDDVSFGIDIHPLVHTWARERQDMTTQRQSWYAALLALALACPERKSSNDYRYESMRSHIRACLTHRKMEYVQGLEPRTIPAVLMHLLWAQMHLQEDYQADDLLALTEIELRNGCQNSIFSVTRTKRGMISNDQLHMKRKRSSSEESNTTPENLQILALQALYLDLRGDKLSSLYTLQFVSDTQKEMLGPEHPDFLASQCWLADVYFTVGRNEKAIEVLEYHMPTVSELTVSDPLRSAYLHRLARACRKSGQIKRAVSICKEIVKIDRQTLELTDRRRLHSKIQLAIAYQSNSQHEKAIDLLEHVINVQNKILHATHPSVLDTQYHLAQAYWYDGRQNEARALLEQVLEADSQKSNNSKNLATDLNALGRFYALDCQDEKAIELYKRASEVDDKSNLDVWDYSRLITRSNLARAYESAGKKDEAIRLMESTVDIEGRDKIDAGNKNLIKICRQLVKAYRSSGHSEKANSFEKRIPSSEAAATSEPRRETTIPAATEASQENNPSAPLCSCGKKAVRLITGPNNTKGNAGKAYWKCKNQMCLKWLGWA